MCSSDLDGQGPLLTTSTCLLAPSRNPQLDRSALEAELKRRLGVKRVLWLEQSALAGDDTDAHIDTLVRFCPNDTLVFVPSQPSETWCETRPDRAVAANIDPRPRAAPAAVPLEAAQRLELANHGWTGSGPTPPAEKGDSPSDLPPGAAPRSDPLERQLRALRTLEGQPYRLVPLPAGPPRHAPDDGRPLPATYANALFLNGNVFLPVYGDPERDAAAVAAWQQACPGWRVTPLDCSALLLQHGSLHCATMQIPAAVFG